MYLYYDTIDLFSFCTDFQYHATGLYLMIRIFGSCREKLHVYRSSSHFHPTCCTPNTITPRIVSFVCFNSLFLQNLVFSHLFQEVGRLFHRFELVLLWGSGSFASGSGSFRRYMPSTLLSLPPFK